MKYAEIFRNYVRDSGLSLSQLCDLLHERGFKTTKSHLSKLQNGKLPPAGDKLNDALAEVLSVDPVELKVAAYREKISPEVLARLNEKGVS
ncbi:XRE family transcriptional regulator [Paenibacillus sp. FSL H8-0317]|uniref:XRE family transcriptional regulator n=1 Tax=Paenibacillus sp. FSL H8-0317 TaxID=2921385 RepID=UPI0032542C3D